MMEEFFITTGLAGLFMVRGFVPAFCIALVLRFGADFGITPELATQMQEAAGSVGVAPSWFTSNTALVVLGILAALEVGATKDPDLRELLNTVDSYIKPVMAGLTSFGIMSTTDVSYLESTYQEAGMIGVAMTGGLIVATWLGSVAKSTVVSSINDMDPDDSLGLMRAVSFVGDAWAVVGALLVLLVPVLVAAIALSIFGIVAILKRRAHKRDGATKRPCVSCSESVYSSALFCPSCGAEQSDVHSVNWIGAAVDAQADPENHRQKLLAVGRCPRCATRISRKAVKDGCPSCQANLFADTGLMEQYTQFLQGRVMSTLIVCGLVGLIPILGFAIGIVVYKIRLVGPYRRYLGRGIGMGTRWMLRIVLLVAIFLQLVPGLNAGVVAGMALLSFVVYRGLFNKRVRRMGEPIPETS